MVPVGLVGDLALYLSDDAIGLGLRDAATAGGGRMRGCGLRERDDGCCHELFSLLCCQRADARRRVHGIRA